MPVTSSFVNARIVCVRTLPAELIARLSAVIVASSLSYDDTYSCVDSSSVIALSLF